jgi:hypothetical protein
LDADIEGPYGRLRGGSGGWWIIDEPEVHFVLDTELTVPDIAGWRKAHMPSPPEGPQDLGDTGLGLRSVFAIREKHRSRGKNTVVCGLRRSIRLTR